MRNIRALYLVQRLGQNTKVRPSSQHCSLVTSELLHHHQARHCKCCSKRCGWLQNEAMLGGRKTVSLGERKTASLGEPRWQLRRRKVWEVVRAKEGGHTAVVKAGIATKTSPEAAAITHLQSLLLSVRGSTPKGPKLAVGRDRKPEVSSHCGGGSGQGGDGFTNLSHFYAGFFWILAPTLEAFLVPAACLWAGRYHRITEYSDLEETHKDHHIQLLSEWPI